MTELPFSKIYCYASVAVHTNEQAQYYNPQNPFFHTGEICFTLQRAQSLSQFPPKRVNCLFSTHRGQLEQMFLLLKPFYWKNK